MTMVERQRNIVREASSRTHYLLPRRFTRLRDASVKTEVDLEYEACESLVYSGHARWLAGELSPGIRLTGKPFDAALSEGDGTR